MNGSSGSRCCLREGDAVGDQSGRQQGWLSWGFTSILSLQMGGDSKSLARLLSSGFQGLLHDPPNVSLGSGCPPVIWLPHGTLGSTHSSHGGVLPLIYLSSSMNIEVKNVSPECSIAPSWRNKDGALGAASEVPPTSPWGTEGPVSPSRTHASPWGELRKARISESPIQPPKSAEIRNLSPSIFLPLLLPSLCSLCLKPPLSLFSFSPPPSALLASLTRLH